MSPLWFQDATGEWVAHPLECSYLRLTPTVPIPIAREQLGAVDGPVLVRSVGEHAMERWVLICPPGDPVRVNGARVPIGVRALSDRDVISVNGDPDRRSVCLSLERAPEIVPFTDGHDAASCIRCKLPLKPETPAVRCPNPECGLWHHESPDQPCWRYGDGCAGCGHPTAFDAGFQWTPHLL